MSLYSIRSNRDRDTPPEIMQTFLTTYWHLATNADTATAIHATAATKCA